MTPEDITANHPYNQATQVRRESRIQDFYQSIPPLDPPRDWEEVEEIVQEEIAQDANE